MVEELEITEQVEQQQDPPTKKRALYDAVSKKYNLGSYEEFETKLKDPTKRKALYDHVGKEFELGTFQEFETKLQEPTPSKKKESTVNSANGGAPTSSPTQSSSKAPSLFGNFGTKDEYIAANPSYKPENVLQPPKQLAVKDETRLPKPIVGETLDAELANRERYQKTKDDKPSKIIAEMKSNVPESLGGTMTKEKASLGTALAKGFSSVASSTLKSIGVAAKDLDFFNEYDGKKAEDLATYKAGVKIDNWVSDLVGDLSPEDQERFSIKLAQGAGQMAGFVLGGIGGKALKISPLLTTAGLGAAVSGASEYEAAMQAGANPDQASKAFWINAGLGTTEALPIMSAFRKMDKYTGGLATGVLAKKLSSTAGGRLTNEMAGGILYETAQETFVQALSNVAAANTYDATRKVYDGLLETAGISSIIGGAMTGASIAIRNKREAGGLTKEEDNQLAIAQKFAEEKAEESFNPDKKELTTTTPDNPKVKAITKAKTDIEADLASTDLPKETQDAMQMEVAALDEQLESAKTEAYQQELDVEKATIIKSEIAKNEALLADGNLSEGTKSLIQKQIDTDKEKLSQIKLPEPSYKINGQDVSEEVFLSNLESKKPLDYEYNGEDATIIQKLKDVGGKSETTTTEETIVEPTTTDKGVGEVGSGVGGDVGSKLEKPYKTVNDGSGKMVKVVVTTTEKNGVKTTKFKTQTTNKQGESREQNDKGFNTFEEAVENLGIDLKSEENESALELIQAVKESQGKENIPVRVTEIREGTDKSSPFYGKKVATLVVGGEKVDVILEQSLKETTKAETPTTTKESNVVEGQGSVGVGVDGFKQAGEKARDTKDATHIGRWMLDNSQKGDVVRFQDGGYEVTEVNTKKDGTKELVLTPFEFNENGSKDYNNTGIKIITEQSIKNGSNLFENAYTNSKGERVIEQSTYEPVDQPSPTQESKLSDEGSVGVGGDVVELSNGNKLVLNKDRSVKAGKNFAFDENSYDVQDKDGNNIGNVHIADKGEYYQISNVKLKNERTGLGTEIYKKLISELDKPLISDKALSEKAKGLWDKLVKDGVAEKFKDTFELGGKTYTEDRYRTKQSLKETTKEQSLSKQESGGKAPVTKPEGKSDVVVDKVDDVGGDVDVDKVYYHGTPNKDFNGEFDERKIGERDSGFIGRGFYFTEDKSIADQYQHKGGKKGKILERKLDIKNPLRLDKEHINPQELAKDVFKYIDEERQKKGKEPYRQEKREDDIAELTKKLTEAKHGTIVGRDLKEWIDISDYAKSRGHDAIIGSKEVVVFDKSQIKAVEQSLKETPKAELKIGDTVELPPQIEGAAPRVLQYTENGWMQSVGGELTNISEGVKKQANEKFKAQEIVEPIKIKENEIKEETTQEGLLNEEVPRETIEQGKKSLANRVYEGKTPEEVKAAVEKNGLTYDIEKQSVAEKNAVDFMEEVGTENALSAIRNGEVTDAAETFIFGKAIDDVYKQSLLEKDPAIKAELLTKETKLIKELDERLRSKGRAISAANAVYQNSDFGYKLGTIIERAKEANNGELPKEVTDKLTDLSVKLDEANRKLEELKRAKPDPSLIIKEPVKRQSLSPEKLTRKLELRKKYAGVFNDVTNIPRLIAEKEFREYAGLVLEEMAGDFKSFSTEMINTVGKGIREHLPKLYKELGGKENPEMAKIATGLKKSIAEYERKLNEKDFDSKKRIKPELDKSTFDLLVERNKLKDQVDLEIEKLKLKNRSNTQKLKDGFVDVLNLPKSLIASADMSAPLRQGAILSARNPKIAAKSTVEMFRQAFSEAKSIDWLTRLRSSPEYATMKDAGLYFAEPTAKLSAKEEQFISNIAHKIPIWGRVVKGSERAYTGYLNKLRADVFTSFHDALIADGIKGEQLNKELKSFADFINNASGRGSLGRFEESTAVLNAGFFSPRYAISRFNLLSPVKYAKMTPRARAEALRSVGTYIGMGAVVLALAKAGGAEVSVDMRSADGGKIKVGNTRFDVWAGFQQWVRLMTQIATGEKVTIGGKTVDLTDEKYGKDSRLDILGRFGRSKASPTAGLIMDMLDGEDMMGNPITFKFNDLESFAKSKEGQLIIPLYLQDIKKTIDEGSMGITAASIPLSFFGVGVQTYEEDKPKGAWEINSRFKGDKPKIEQLLKDEVTEVKSVSAIKNNKSQRDPESGEVITIDLTPAQTSSLKEAQEKAIKDFMKGYQRSWTNEQFESKLNKATQKAKEDYLKKIKLR